MQQTVKARVAPSCRVQHAAVIPKGQHTGGPLMPINKLSLGLVRKKLHEQRAGLGLRKTLNPDGVTWIHKQRRPATFRVRLTIG